MKDFFLEKFNLEFRSNELIIQSISDQEEFISEQILAIFSHIINMHHIWLTNMQSRKPESFSWDLLPTMYLSALNRQNYLDTVKFIEEIDTEIALSKHPSVSVEIPIKYADILFHVLQHSAYHRGQLIHLLKKDNLNYPSLQWVSIE